MTKDEALKLALEALEKIFRTEYHIETPPIESLEEKMRRIAYKAITAIKEALAQPEPEYLAFMDTPQRKWVGLTFDERLELADDVDWPAGAYCEYAEKIEVKLKELNT